jgi:ABC-type phosphate transport system substrate-binding protein
MLMTKTMFAGFFAVGLSATSMLACADVVVVISAKSAVSSLTNEQAADIFLRKVSTLPDGGPAVPIDQPEGTDAKEQFYSKVANKNAAQLKAYWSKQIFTGKGRPPKEARDNAEVKHLVVNNPDMIGYIDKNAVDATVKIVLTIK